MRFLLAFVCLLFVQYGFSQKLEEKPIQNNQLEIKKVEPKALLEVENPQVISVIDSPLIQKPTPSEPIQAGELIEVKDDRIDLLIQDYTENKKTIGYRVQLFSGNSRWEALKIKSDFLKKHKTEKPPHLVYQSPNFKIRVGDYRDRLEAQKFLELYKIDYPSAFIVKDEIEITIPE